MITAKHFKLAKAAVKKTFNGDYTASHTVAMDSLRSNNPDADAVLIQDMGWQVVMAFRLDR
jgi:hypothetical protein